MTRGFVQAAGVHDISEMLLLAQCGVDAAGFPLRLPVHAEDCGEDEAAAIIREARQQGIAMAATCITYENDPAEAVGLTRRIGASILQLHGDILPAGLARLRTLGPELFIIKSLIVGRSSEGQLLGEARAAAPYVDAFITDTFDPASGATGATGRVHNWETSRRIARETGIPLMLAGGLGLENVAEAIRQVGPAAVDAHTGLEGPDGRKDAVLVEAFVREARHAFAGLNHAAAGTAPWPVG
ncbi:phosphoribosylanthranilate isomerase [Oceanidesulfovibrio marinus]|uniref:N-(5'-phosphoribosyl)anthranilate isomerase n=1 Tax=Oceanidesulfovibrio marinus TaxID=370038 RepID=A0ABX6NEM7_9BACT|nr:phosphoribosylanthranilate isomerase [Oceanidesulfovibrio marinus]